MLPCSKLGSAAAACPGVCTSLMPRPCSLSGGSEGGWGSLGAWFSSYPSVTTHSCPAPRLQRTWLPLPSFKMYVGRATAAAAPPSPVELLPRGVPLPSPQPLLLPAPPRPPPPPPRLLLRLERRMLRSAWRAPAESSAMKASACSGSRKVGGEKS